MNSGVKPVVAEECSKLFYSQLIEPNETCSLINLAVAESLIVCLIHICRPVGVPRDDSFQLKFSQLVVVANDPCRKIVGHSDRYLFKDPRDYRYDQPGNKLRFVEIETFDSSSVTALVETYDGRRGRVKISIGRVS